MGDISIRTGLVGGVGLVLSLVGVVCKRHVCSDGLSFTKMFGLTTYKDGLRAC